MTLKPAPKPEPGFSERQAPEFVTFEKPGTRIAGRLLAVNSIEIDGKPVVQYILTNETRSFKILGTYDLTQKISRRDVGALLIIEYLGTDDSVKTRGNPMRVFHVQIKRDEHSATFADGSPVEEP